MLKLDKIISLLPQPWPRHAPANGAHIERAMRDPVSAAVIGTNPGRFPGMCGVPRYLYPEASEEALLLGLELNIWGFYFDDPFDDGDISLLERTAGTSLIGRMVEVLETGASPPDPSPLELLCLQFRERARMLCRGRPQTWRRFVQSCVHWTDSVLPAARTQHFATLPDLSAYNEVRRTNIGIIPLACINEIDGPLQLDEAFFADPVIRRLHELTCLIIVHCNDLYSYEKERRLSAQPFNSLFLRQHHYHLGLEAAFEQHLAGIAAWLNELSELDGRLRAEVPVEPGDRAQKQAQALYVERLKGLILGNHLWSINDGRYSSLTSPFEELRVTKECRVKLTTSPNRPGGAGSPVQATIPRST